MKYKNSILIVISMIIGLYAQLRLESEEKNYLLYEPIYVYIEYKGQNPIMTDLGNGQVVLTVTNLASKEERIYVPIAHYDGEPLNIPNNYKSSSIATIASDRFGWVFPKEGTYSVFASATDFKIQSNPIILNIIRPMAGIDYGICNELKDCSEMKMFENLEGGDMFEEALTLSEKIANGTSSYKSAFRELIAKNYSQHSFSRKTGFREPDLNKAITFMAPISEQSVTQSKVIIQGQPFSVRYLGHVRTLALLNRISNLNKGNIHEGKIKSAIMEFKERYKNIDIKHSGCGNFLKD